MIYYNPASEMSSRKSLQKYNLQPAIQRMRNLAVSPHLNALPLTGNRNDFRKLRCFVIPENCYGGELTTTRLPCPNPKGGFLAFPKSMEFLFSF